MYKKYGYDKWIKPIVDAIDNNRFIKEGGCFILPSHKETNYKSEYE